jgi:predicted nucleic acid-binding protein
MLNIEEKARYALDTSAFFTYFEEEDGADKVQSLFEMSKSGKVEIFASFVSYVEVFYITCQNEGEESAKCRIELMNELPMSRIDSNEELGLLAGRIKANYKLSFADAWVAATAIILDAILVHKDPEFRNLKDKIKMLELPYN